MKILNARKQKQKFCSYLNDDFDCTAPTYEYDYCIMFRIRYNEIKEDVYIDWGRIQDLVEF